MAVIDRNRENRNAVRVDAGQRILAGDRVGDDHRGMANAIRSRPVRRMRTAPTAMASGAPARAARCLLEAIMGADAIRSRRARTQRGRG